MTAASGFSLLEMIIAMALTLSLTAALFSMTRGSNAASAVQSEAADIAQRMRVGVDAMTRDLMNAGAGSYLAGHAGPLNHAVPPILPFRQELTAADPPGSFRNDIITLISVPATAAQTVLT